MNEIIKGFQTTSGVKQYDYDFLGNKPDLSIYLEKDQVDNVAQPNKVLRLNENGILPADITGKAGSVEWNSIQGIPDGLSGFGLDDEVYTKGEVYNKEEINELIGNIENAGTDNAIALHNHNTSTEAHEYIRNLIDQLANDKISKTDIINNLTSLLTDKPLSAAQGAALKKLIDEITVPTKISELEEDSEHRTVTDAEKAKWDKPSIEVDTTLTESGKAADAKTVGDKFDNLDIPTKLSDLTDDANHRLVTDEEKAKWDAPSIKLDTTLEQEGMAADAKAVGDALKQKQPIGDYALNSAIPTQLSQLQSDENHRTVTDAEKAAWNEPSIEVDETLTQTGMAADAQAVGQKIEQIKTVAKNEAPSNLQGLWIDLDDNSDDGSLVDETLTQSGMAADARATGNSIRKKVDKIDGKTLSSNDFTNEEKTKLSNIEAEANKTIVDTELANSDNAISNRAVNSAITNLIAQKQNKINTELLLLMPPSWVDNTYTATVPGINENTTVIISPGPKTFKEYSECGVYCSGQGENVLIFSCDAVSENSLYVNVLYFE